MSWRCSSSNTAIADSGTRPSTPDVIVSAYPFTVSGWGWINAYTGSGAMPALWQANPANTSSNIRLCCSGTGQAGFRIGGSSTAALTTRTLPVKVWGHFCGTATGANSRYAFLNGQDKTQNVVLHSLGTNGAQWTNGASSGSNWNGFGAEVAVWDVELTDWEIYLLSQGISPLRIRIANLKSYMPLRNNTWDYAANKARRLTFGTVGTVMFDQLDPQQHPDVEDLTSDKSFFAMNAAFTGSGSFFPLFMGAL